MATTLTRNLKLRINSNLTADSKYNLERLDLLGSTFLTDSTDTLRIRSQTDISIEPESADLGGSGSGGVLSIGSNGQNLSSVAVFSDAVSLNSPLSLLDQAVGGTKSMLFRYKSDVQGTVESISDRTLSVDLDGGDRAVVLTGDLKIQGGSLELTVPSSASLILPATGTVSTLAGVETLTNKAIDADQNSITNIRNANVAASAGIVYSKLNLATSIQNSDVAPGAAIAYTKLNLSNSITNSDINTVAAVSRTKLANGTPDYVVINSGSGQMTEEPYLSRARGGAGQNQTNVTYPSTGVLVTEDGVETLTGKTISGNSNTLTDIPAASVDLTDSITNSDINSSAAIAYSKLNLTGSIVNADVSASASLSRSKISTATPDTIVVNDGSGFLSTLASLDILRGGTGAATANDALNNLLPDQTSATGQVLQSDGSNASWAAVGTGSVTSVALTAPAEFSVAGSPITTTGTLVVTKATQSANAVWAGPTSGGAATPAFRSLVLADLPMSIPYSQLTLTGSIIDADISNTAAISISKLASLTAGRALQTDGSGIITVTTTTATELGYVNGVTSAIQTQLDGKQPLDSDLTALAALSSTGLIARTGSGSVAARTLTAGTGISISNGDGVSANPTISSSITQYNDEMAQDAVGTILTDSSSLDFTYDDSAPSITAVVLPGGVNHDQLLNYVADKHVAHSTVQIATSSTSGLSGGGDITTTRNLTVDPTQASTVSPASGDLVLFADISNSNALAKTTVQAILDLGGGKTTATWSSGDGTSKAVTHSYGTTDVSVNVYVIDTGEDILVDSVVRTNSNTVTLTSSQAPTGSGWKVIVRK